MSNLLPTEISKKISTLSNHIILIYGRPKIGKSTLAGCFPNPIFLCTEPLRTLDIHKVDINSWGKFLDVCGELAEGKHSFKNIIIDTYDNLAMYATEYICQEKDIEDIGDYKKYGAYHLVTAMLRLKIAKLASLGYGLILNSHSKLIEIETRTGKYNKMTLAIGGQKRDVALNIPDIVLYMDSEMKDGKEIGIVRTKPSLYWDAGDRTKKLPESIYFDLAKPEMIYEELNKYFN